MAFDGVTIAALCAEFQKALTGGRIVKITQADSYELCLTIKTFHNTNKLLIGVNPTLPLMRLSDEPIKGADSAPIFCMSLRKYIGGGRIQNIYQPGLERIIRIDIEHCDELGDMSTRTLVIEMMGKHSNIILINQAQEIIDAIKHIGSTVSSVRQVLPQKAYFVPNAENKIDPLSVTRAAFINRIRAGLSEYANQPEKLIYTAFSGLSPLLAKEIIYRAGMRDLTDSTDSADSVNEENLQTDKFVEKLYEAFEAIIANVKNKTFKPCAYFDAQTNRPIDYSAVPLWQLEKRQSEKDINTVHFDTMSNMLNEYYEKKAAQIRIAQKTCDLTGVLKTLLERGRRKLILQQEQLETSNRRGTYKNYGILLQSYAHTIEKGANTAVLSDFDTGSVIKIPLDQHKSAMENANVYFEKYKKMKRTAENLEQLTKETAAAVEHLESILACVEMAETDDDLIGIRSELYESGFIKKAQPKADRKKSKGKGGKPMKEKKASPIHYVNSDGYDFYVGKNNYQNEEVTFKIGNANDWWFHAKAAPGSHVLVKSMGKDLPDIVFTQAAGLAAYYSKLRDSNIADIDYTQIKHLKRPAKAPAGFVIYHTYFSMGAKPGIDGLTKV